MRASSAGAEDQFGSVVQRQRRRRRLADHSSSARAAQRGRARRRRSRSAASVCASVTRPPAGGASMSTIVGRSRSARDAARGAARRPVTGTLLAADLRARRPAGARSPRCAARAGSRCVTRRSATEANGCDRVAQRACASTCSVRHAVARAARAPLDLRRLGARDAGDRDVLDRDEAESRSHIQPPSEPRAAMSAQAQTQRARRPRRAAVRRSIPARMVRRRVRAAPTWSTSARPSASTSPAPERQQQVALAQSPRR